ncbi:hypothetical protein GOV10_03355 [Candidatus Woesearchaeota archaeon]|nr:hypothetical protein [Candidatus Woesearchaeota archaeon]
MEKQAPATSIENKDERSAIQQSVSTIEPKKEFLRASIDQAGIKIDIQSENATKALTEIRRIVESLGTTTIEPDDFTTFELSTLLSEEFVNDKNAMKEIKKLLNREQQYRVVKALLPAIEEIDLIAGKKFLRLENKTIKEGVYQLTKEIDVGATRHALVHIKGLLEEQERMIIADRVHEQIPHAQIKAYQTEQDIEGKILIEAMFFGDYEEVV